MTDLASLVRNGRNVRVIGFDEAPFTRGRGRDVPLIGVVCAGTRFEGMVCGRVRQDGWNATDAVARVLVGGKFLRQSHLILLDGIAFGGFNIVDLPQLSDRLGRPCSAVMRRRPDMPAVERALQRLSRPAKRLERLRRAGPIHEAAPFVFQCAGAPPEAVGAALAAVTDTGFVPEALRLAHLIGGAMVTGESGRRA